MVDSTQIHDGLKRLLKQLRLSTIQSCYSDIADQARSESLSYEHFLYELLKEEARHREQKRIERYLRASKLPMEKTIEAFDRKRLPGNVNGQVSVLLEGGFLARKENILAFGNPGSGKTHLLCGIGHEFIQQGYRILLRSCSLLVQDLLIAKRDLELPKALKKLSCYDDLLSTILATSSTVARKWRTYLPYWQSVMNEEVLC